MLVFEDVLLIINCELAETLERFDVLLHQAAPRVRNLLHLSQAVVELAYLLVDVVYGVYSGLAGELLVAEVLKRNEVHGSDFGEAGEEFLRLL